MAGAKDGSSGGRGCLLALVFPVFVSMLAFALLVLVRGVLVFFVLAAVLVFLPLVFAATAVMFGPLLCLLSVGLRLLLEVEKEAR